MGEWVDGCVYLSKREREGCRVYEIETKKKESGAVLLLVACKE